MVTSLCCPMIIQFTFFLIYIYPFIQDWLAVVVIVVVVVVVSGGGGGGSIVGGNIGSGSICSRCLVTASQSIRSISI